MTDVTHLLWRIEAGDATASETLLPLVYAELRKLAASKLTKENPGQTLQATALVHEAYLRLLGPSHTGPSWDGRAHFFAAAAEAMRRILVENARRKGRDKHGGGHHRVGAELDALAIADDIDPLMVLSIHEALDRLAERSDRKAQLVKLRYFVGCTLAEAAEILGISVATAEEDWAYARAWLRREWLREQAGTVEKNKGKSPLG